MRLPASLLALFALVLALPAAKTPLVLSDVDTPLPEVASRLVLAGPGVPKQVDLELASAGLSLGAGDTFSLLLDEGSELTGTFTRKRPASRTLRLELDAQGEQALIDSLGARVIDLVAPGAPISEVTGAIAKARLAVRLKLSKKTGSASARLTGRFAVELGLHLVGPDAQPLAVRLKLSGTSESFPLDVLLGG